MLTKFSISTATSNNAETRKETRTTPRNANSLSHHSNLCHSPFSNKLGERQPNTSPFISLMPLEPRKYLFSIQYTQLGFKQHRIEPILIQESVENTCFYQTVSWPMIFLLSICPGSSPHASRSYLDLRENLFHST